MTRAIRAPRTKEELINKMLSFDFDGDIRHLGENVTLQRVAPHVVRLMFPDTGRVFDLTAHIPRSLVLQGAKPEPAATRPQTTRRQGRRQ